MFSASRLGFWFRYPLQPDRRLSTNRVLVFYDNYTQGPAGQTDYYNTGGDVNPGTDVWPVIQAREISLGMQPELIVGYNNLPADLTQYAHLWDIGYASPYGGNPTLNPTTLLTTYLQQGGAMFMLGENANFTVRDDTIELFIYGLSNQLPVTGSITTEVFTQTVASEFLLANNSNSIEWGAPGEFTSYGTGTPMTTGGGYGPVAVSWKTGSLVNAPKGAVVAVLDINFFGSGLGIQYYNPDFIDNLSLTLNEL
jgi:hypothetical protein